MGGIQISSGSGKIGGTIIASQERDEIARDSVGKMPFRRYGHNDTCGLALETIWHGSTLYTYLTAAERLKVTSVGVNAGNDVVAGTGARTLFIQGLDANYDIINETIILTGGVAATTINSYLRVFKARVASAGATGYNEGDIHIRNNADAVDLLICLIQEAESHACIWTVPNGYTAYISSWRGSESSNKGTDMSLWIRTFAEWVWLYKRGVYTMDTIFEFKFSIPIKVAAKSDIEMRVMSFQDGAKVSALFRGWYE